MRVGTVDPVRAATQHHNLRDLLLRLGAKVEVVPFVHGAFDSVFIKDNALLVRRAGESEALFAEPRFGQRSIEQAPRRHALAARGYSATEEARTAFEGGDVVLLRAGGAALLGTGFRSSPRARAPLARFLRQDVHLLELRDPFLYHLDTAFAALSDGTVVYCPDAFTTGSRAWIEGTFPAPSRIRVSYSDACAFAINIIEVGSQLVLGGPSHLLSAQLRERGFSVHSPDLSEFRLAGGSAACLVSRLHAVDDVAVKSARATAA